jgi:pyruvate/2-oxoglutarate dehydrogenase complex dihydrolipoamide acyltransferase (E2) component
MPPRSPSHHLGSAFARLALGLLAALLVTTGSTSCGATDRSGLSSADASRLRADIAAARKAAARHEAPQAASSLVAFRQQVSRLEAQHKLTTAQAQALETGAQQAQARVALDVRPAPAPPQATVTTTAPAPAPTPPAPPAPPAPPGKAKGHDDKHGPGKPGHGPGNDSG